jgi:pimeloyl-ACP methyl ester carboxylesterase
VKPACVFIHGLEGSSQGTKARFFKERFPHMLITDYRGPLEARMATLRNLLTGHPTAIIVGSSYGGLMGALYAFEQPKQIKKLILLAPALTFPEFTPLSDGRVPAYSPVPTIIFHGTQDDVIPIGPVRKIAEKVFPNLAFHVLRDDHLLSKTFHTIDWEQCLEQPKEKRPCRRYDNK